MTVVPEPAATETPACTLESAVARWSRRFGQASTEHLRARAEPALRELGTNAGADGGSLCSRLELAHEARFGRAALKAEQADDVAREHARASGLALARYERHWARAITRLARAHPQRWRVPGLSDDEVRDALTLRLIELIVAPPADAPRGRPGKAWGLCVVQAELAVLRRSFRLAATPTDFDAAPVLERRPSQEDGWLALEAEQRRALAAERARQQLNQPQRSWLEALQHSAAEGEFFASSDQLNLSAASRKLGKNRSSAQRAYRGLQACFQRELEHLA